MRRGVKSKLPGLTQVVWEDSWSNHSYNYTEEEIQKETPKVLVSCGFVCRDDKSGITLALEVDDCNSKRSFRHVQHIPRAMIRSVKKVKL